MGYHMNFSMKSAKDMIQIAVFLKSIFFQIWLFEAPNQKIKFDGMFKMPGRDFEKFSFSAGKMADSHNPGFKSEKTLRCTVSHQLYYLSSTFGNVSSDFDEIFMIFKNLYGSEKACYYHRHSGFGTNEGQRLRFCENIRISTHIQNLRS